MLNTDSISVIQRVGLQARNFMNPANSLTLNLPPAPTIAETDRTNTCYALIMAHAFLASLPAKETGLNPFSANGPRCPAGGYPNDA